MNGWMGVLARAKIEDCWLDLGLSAHAKSGP
jgi:hypothetical protein